MKLFAIFTAYLSSTVFILLTPQIDFTNLPIFPQPFMPNNFVLFSAITFQWNFIIVLGWCIWLHRVIVRSSPRQSVTTVKSHRTFGTVTWNSSATYTRTPAVFVWSEWPPTTLTPHLQAPETFVAVWPIPVTGVSWSLFENTVFTFFRKINKKAVL